MIRVMVYALALLTLMSGTAFAQASSKGDRCATDSVLRISEDSVGPFDVRAKIGFIRASCPTAFVTTQQGMETTNPALGLRLGRVSVLAVEFRDSLTDDATPDVWEIAAGGGPGRLPLGLTLDSTWEAFSRAFGKGFARGQERRVEVEFCRFPRLILEFDALNPDGVVAHDLSFIPAKAKLTMLWVLTTTPPGTRRDCGT